MYKVNSTVFLIKSRIFLSALFLIFSSVSTLFSQQSDESSERFRKGFIITNNRDSLNGSLKGTYKNQISKIIWFKAISGNIIDLQPYTPFDISSFGNRSGNSRYTSASIPLIDKNELVFVRQLIEGEYDLLFYKLNNEKHLCLRSPQNVITDLTYRSENKGYINKKLSDEEFSALLNNLLSDVPEMRSRLNETKPTKRSVARLIADFHSFAGKSYSSFGVNNTGVSVGFMAGMTADQLYIKTSGNSVRSSYGIYPYAGINFSLFSKSTGLGVMAESSVSKKSFHYSYSVQDSDLTTYNETFFETMCLNNRLGVTYCGRRKDKLTPFFEFGGSASFFISPVYDNYTDILYTNVNFVNSALNHDELHSGTYCGVFFRPGANLRINSKNALKIAGEYSVSLGMNGEQLSMAGFSLIYQFNLK